MFESLIQRAERLARRRAGERADALAQRLSAELPRGIAAERDPAGVRLSGRRIARRFALDPKLRWIFTELIR